MSAGHGLAPSYITGMCIPVATMSTRRSLRSAARESSSATGHSRWPAQKRGTACQSTSGQPKLSLHSRVAWSHICLNSRTDSSDAVRRPFRLTPCYSAHIMTFYYLAIQRSVWRDIKFAFFVCLFVQLRISQRRMVRSAWNFCSG